MPTAGGAGAITVQSNSVGAGNTNIVLRSIDNNGVTGQVLNLELKIILLRLEQQKDFVSVLTVNLVLVFLIVVLIMEHQVKY